MAFDFLVRTPMSSLYFKTLTPSTFYERLQIFICLLRSTTYSCYWKRKAGKFLLNSCWILQDPDCKSSQRFLLFTTSHLTSLHTASWLKECNSYTMKYNLIIFHFIMKKHLGFICVSEFQTNIEEKEIKKKRI